MNLSELILLLIKVSIVLVTFGFGLKAKWSDATSLFRHPGELFRSFLAMNIVMLLFAVALVKFFSLNKAVEMTLIFLALSPVPPFLPGKQFKAGGEASYVYGLLVAMSVLAIVAVPLLVTWTGRLFDLEEHIDPMSIAKVLLITILVPLGAGIFFHSLKPDFAERASKWVLIVGNILLGVSALFILIGAWHSIGQLIGNGTLVALAAFGAVGLLVGHLLGGPSPGHRSALALATASRHPAVALAIAHATFPNEKRVLAAVLLYLIVATVVSIPYLKWHKKHFDVSGEPKEKMRWRQRHA